MNGIVFMSRKIAGISQQIADMKITNVNNNLETISIAKPLQNRHHAQNP